MENNLQSRFEQIRDIPYSIPLSTNVEDRCCTGKHKLFLEALSKLGYKARWRVCTFKWSKLNLPETLLTVPHEDDSTHAYLEALIENEWQTIDLTWDKKLKKILTINEWSNLGNMVVGVPVLVLFSPEESTMIINNETQGEVERDLKINGSFYKAFNYWLEEERVK